MAKIKRQPTPALNPVAATKRIQNKILQYADQPKPYMSHEEVVCRQHLNRNSTKES